MNLAAGEPAPSELVWYVSYGSNMNADRLSCYIQGGRPPGALRGYRGAREVTPPRADAAVTLPGRVHFATESTVWGGGIAFYDHATPGPTPARAFLISVGQFVDIAAQEMQREARADDPLETVIRAGLPSGRHQAGPGKYETLLEVGRREGRPMLTFTAPEGIGAMAPVAPTQAYLAMLADGLQQAHGWDPARSEAYFAECGAFAHAA